MHPGVFAAAAARADTAAAKACATRLPKDAKAIFNATLPQVAPGSDLRSLLTSNTPRLAIFGTIDRGNARQSTAAAERLKLGGA
jgi:hypothetical protein